MQLTTNTQAFIEAEQYSDFVLLNMHDGLLPTTFWRDIKDFMHGSTLNIKTVGSVTLQEASEDTPLVYNPIESGEITFTITEYVGNAWYITDDLREDGNQIDILQAQHAQEQTRALQERYETDFLSTAASVYFGTSAPATINGFPHFVVSAETNNIFDLTHLIDMRLAFDKANVPAEGRVFICDGVVEATLNKSVSITNDVTQFASAILEKGLARGMNFFGSWFGWTLITSNRLFQGAANDGTTSITGVYNMAMCIADDQCKPLMGAWRRLPKTEGERNKDLARDEFVVRSRYGFGVQRVDSLGCIVTSPTATV
ncbi:MAG: hypothetical protein KUG64_11285 [Cycloclasticus sp.]|nr:hypothetical protein [Cycloclasticus sp.]